MFEKGRLGDVLSDGRERGTESIRHEEVLVEDYSEKCWRSVDEERKCFVSEPTELLISSIRI